MLESTVAYFLVVLFSYFFLRWPSGALGSDRGLSSFFEVVLQFSLLRQHGANQMFLKMNRFFIFFPLHSSVKIENRTAKKHNSIL